MTDRDINLLHDRAEKEYKHFQSESMKSASPYVCVLYENIYLAIISGEWDRFASALTQIEFPIAFFFEELKHAEDFIYSGIVDFITFRLEEDES